MPPKKNTESVGSDVTLSGKNIAALTSYLRNLEGTGAEWKVICDEIDIKATGNAQRAFRDALKKLNHDFKGGKISKLGDEATAAPTKSTTNGKKRKSDAKAKDDDSEDSNKRVKTDDGVKDEDLNEENETSEDD